MASGGTGFDNCGPDANAERLAQPFTAPWPQLLGPGSAAPNGNVFNPTNSCLSYLNYITMIKNIYDSNYNGLQMTLTGRNYHGLSFTAGYTYSHALGDASDQGTSANFPVPLNSYGNIRQQMYANTDFDIRHRFTLSVNYAVPGQEGLRTTAGRMVGQFDCVVTSGLPWGLSDQSDDFSGTNVLAPKPKTWVNSGISSVIQLTSLQFMVLPIRMAVAKRRGGLPFFAGGGDI